MTTAFVTGPTGAVGTALIKVLIENNIKVVAVVNPSSKRLGNIPDSELVTIVKCDLSELKKLPEIMSKEFSSSKKTGLNNSIFYHLAWLGTTGEARNDMALQLKNIEYALDAVEAAGSLGCARFIGAGSQAEYGRFEGKLTATTPTDPENGYGIAKLAAGKMTRIRAHQLKMEHVWTRILSVYGPNDGSQSMVMSTISKLKNGEVPALTKGEQLWDYLNSKDVGRALYLLGVTDLREENHDNLENDNQDQEKSSKLDGKIYPIGSGLARPLREYIEIIRDIVAPKAELGFGQIPYGPKQVMHLEADISELTADTGFVPTVEFKDGISELLQ